MVVCYWKIGERIVQEELSGKARAGYSEKFIAQLSEKLTRDFGKGFTISNIKYMRQFYSIFPIGHAVPSEKDLANELKEEIALYNRKRNK